MAAIGQDSVTFLASFPAIQSAIKVGQDGMRIQLDVPESEMANAVRLITMREQVLQVTICPLLNNGVTNAVQAGAKRQSRWQAAKD